MEQKKNKDGKSRRETAVQGTNDSSIVSKCSMAAVGYFNDQFLKEFVSKVSRRSPLINRGYYIRATAIDYILNKFLSSTSSKKQILSLGAGFDSAYFRLKSDERIDDVVFCEIDFPDVVKRKHTVISKNSKLNNLIPGYFTQSIKEDPLIEINTEGYKLLGVDLTQHNTLEALLKLCGVDFDLPTLLLSECVLTYMTKRCSSNVVKWAEETFSNSTFVLYEQINPNDPFGLFMQNHFKTIGSALKCINAFPTMDSQLQRFKSLGWERVEAMDMNQFYSNLVRPEERNRVEFLEPFDEYEEWHLKCSHYMVLCAYNGTCNQLLSDISRFDCPVNSQPISSCVTIETVPDVSNVMRIGHASTAVNDTIVTIAGFGKECGKHQRLSSVTITDAKSFKSKLLQLDVDLKKTEVGRLRHSLCSLKDGTVVLIGGRMSPIYSCTQVIKLRLENPEIKNCENLNKLESETEKLKNEMTNSKSTDLNCDARNLNKDLVNPKVSSEERNLNCESQNTNKRNESFDNVEEKPLDCETSNTKKECVDVNTESRHLRSEENNINSELIDKNSQSTNMNCKSKEQDIKKELKTNNSGSNLSNTNDLDNRGNNDMEKFNVINPLVDSSNNKENINCDKTKVNLKDLKSSVEDSVPITLSTVDQSGEIPIPRWRHSAVVFQKSGTDMIFVYGGRNEKQLALNCGYFFNPATGQWKKMCSTGREPGYRQSHTCSVWNNNIIIAGGLDLNLQPLNSIHMLEIETLVWSQFPVDGDLFPRYAHTAQVIDDALVLISGVNLRHDPPGIAVINLVSRACVEYSLPVPDPTFLVMLHQHQICYLGNGRFVVIGGGGNCFSFGTHLNKSPFILDIRKCLQNSPSSVTANEILN